MDFLKEKAGPFPVYVWGIGLGLIAAAYIWMTGRFSGGGSPTAAPPANTDATDVWAGGYATSNSLGVNGSGTIVQESEEQTNFNWTANGVTYLISQRVGPIAAQQALSKYLDGLTITTEEMGWVNQVITKFGLPPEGVYSASPIDTSVEKRAALGKQIEGWFSQYLGRPASQADVEAWLNSGTDDPTAIQSGIAKSNEAQIRASIVQWFIKYTGRAPSAAEINTWAKASPSAVAIEQGIANSPEAARFRNR